MTSSIGIAHSNRIDDATLSGPGAAWTNLSGVQGAGRALHYVATSATDAEADTVFDMTFAAPVTGQVLYIPAHNVSGAGTVRLRCGTTLGASDLADSGAVSAWPFTPMDGFPGDHFGICVVLPAEVNAPYVRVSFSDTSNPDGQVRFSRPFWGPAWFPAISPTKLDDDWMPSLSTVMRLASGADLVHKRRPLRRAGLAFGALTYAEASALHEILRAHDTATEVIYIADRHDRARMQQYGFMALFRELAKTEYPFWKHNGIALGFDQRGGAPL